jgi:Domain of unknown function (DUF932)
MNSAALQSRTTTQARTTFEEVREQVKMDDSGKWDVLARREQLTLRNGDLAVPLDESSEHIERLTPTAWATGQLCQRLNIPVSYFRRCPSVLQDIQANFWLKQSSLLSREDEGRSRNGQASETQQSSKSERWLLRARHGTLRGILSDRYSKLDNETLLGSVQQVLDGAGAGRFSISWFALSDESLHLRLVDPAVAREALPDDRLMAGVHIANSEIGKRAVTVDAMVYRLVCENGLVRLVKGKSLLYQRHIHLPQERFGSALESSVEHALDAAAGFMEQMILATREPIKDVEDTLKRIAERWNLSQQTQEQVQRSLLAEKADQQESLYGLVNSLTSAAQLLPADDRYDIEVLAGHLVEHGVAKSLAVKGSVRRAPDDGTAIGTNGHAVPERSSKTIIAEPVTHRLNGHRGVPTPMS